MALPAMLLAGRTLPLSAGTLPDGETMMKGPFQPSWSSLEQYKVPAWFRDAKFGIWAHWGPQCEPEHGDWYAREMYMEGNSHYKYHLEKYGHPSVFGFKDVIHQWKADQWDPESLVALYKQAGAKYFVALANHHDNLDLYNSKYQPAWNSTKVGPGKDLIDGWQKAARKQGLHFGVSVHAAHTWTWMETAQRSDKYGQYAGIPYDGNLTKKDGKGLWWEGLDPQELYAQGHPLSTASNDDATIHKQWDWGAGASQPSAAYCRKFFNRTVDLINKYDPDLVYFDDTALPLWPASNEGLRIAAHYYNRSIKLKKGLEVVVTGKILDEQQRKCMVWDIERGKSNNIEPLPWQTDTCIGNWHYDRNVYEKKSYKSARTVIQMLVDIVSKNGNLLLSIPVRGNGSIDEEERKIVEEIGRWMALNSESIYGTRPWKIYGEGAALDKAAPMKAQGFNEGSGNLYDSTDIRFVTKGDKLYATVMEYPTDQKVIIKSLSTDNRIVNNVRLTATGASLSFRRTAVGLEVDLPVMPDLPAYAISLVID